MKGATARRVVLDNPLDISIRAPKEGSDRRLLFIGFRCYAFQSALPKKGATWREDKESYGTANFNPRSQRRERQQSYIFAAKIYRISIRAPKEGSDA